MLGAVVLEDAAQVGQAADRDDVADEDEGSGIPSTSQKSSAEPSQSLIRLVAPTGITKKSPTARAIESAIVRPHPAADLLLLALLVLLELGVGRDRQRLEADLERLAERDNPSDHRQAQDAVPLRPGDDRLG